MTTDAVQLHTVSWYLRGSASQVSDSDAHLKWHKSICLPNHVHCASNQLTGRFQMFPVMAGTWLSLHATAYSPCCLIYYLLAMFMPYHYFFCVMTETGHLSHYAINKSKWYYISISALISLSSHWEQTTLIFWSNAMSRGWVVMWCTLTQLTWVASNHWWIRIYTRHPYLSVSVRLCLVNHIVAGTCHVECNINESLQMALECWHF